MRGNKKTALVIAVITLVVCVLFTGYYSQELEVTASHESGFYNDPFELELSGSNGIIYYTTDGSDPDENAIRYDGPILIEDATSHENTNSMRKDMAMDFIEEVSQNENFRSNGFKVPDFLIDKCTVIKAVAIDDQGNVSQTVTRTYFVDFQNRNKYHNTNTMSIVTDPSNLFDYDTGIYITGRIFDEFYSAMDKENMDWAYEWWSTNYRSKGREWERPARITIFDKKKTLLLDGNYGIRIQGGASRALVPKSLNIYARGVYGNKKIPGKIMDVGYDLDVLNLNSGAQTMPYNLPDYLVNTVASGLKIGTRKYIPYQMFLDGEYWGFYFLTERHDESYFHDNYKVDKENIVMIKNQEVEIGEDEDLALYEELVKFFEETDLSVEENYQKACELIDIDNALNYFATEVYIVNYDWSIKNNFALWRARETGGHVGGDGKWRWVIFDVNLALKNSKVRTKAEYFEDEDIFFKALMQNEGFREAFAQKQLYLAEELFEPEKIGQMIDEYREDYRLAIENSANRFYGTDNQYVQNYDSYFDNMKYFFRDRSIITQMRYKGIVYDYNLGDQIFFGQTGEAIYYMDDGFGHSEAPYTWTNGNTSVIRMRTAEPEHDLKLTLHAGVYTEKQRVTIKVNGHVIEECEWKGENTNDYIIPKEWVEGQEELTIEFELPDAISPREYTGASDGRMLGLSIMDMTIAETTK